VTGNKNLKSEKPQGKMHGADSSQDHKKRLEEKEREREKEINFGSDTKEQEWVLRLYGAGVALDIRVNLSAEQPAC